MLRAADAEQVFRPSRFSINDHERLERERAETQNKQLAERNRRHEEQRRRQIEGG
jgi:hypothetical protein